MKNLPNIITKSIYGGLGIVFLIAGFLALFSPFGLSNKIAETVVENPQAIVDITEIAHIVQELGTAIIPIGVLLIWAVFNIEKMAQLNYILLLFAVLFGGIHLYEFIQGNRSIFSPLINSIPFMLVLIVIVIRNKMTIKTSI